jgi:pimeloyl-ACP methyl ester carboxylesterase
MKGGTVHITRAALVALAVAGAIAPGRGMGRPGLVPVACPVQSWEFQEAAFEALTGAKAYFGRYDGGLYRIEIPEKWNGELMLSSHGFVSNAGPQGSRLRVGVPGIREHLIEHGFAWAASSYRCNGYVPGVGLQDTMALTELFARHNGGVAPRRVYLTGTSMGGHITLLGMHEFPDEFAGGLAMCPSGPELFDYFTAVGAAAEVITGIRFDDPASVNLTVDRMLAVTGEPADLTEKGRQLASVQIEISGGPRPFAVEGLASRFRANISGSALAGTSTPSSRAVTNTHIQYLIAEGLGLTAERLNAEARRKAADPQIRHPLGPHEELVPFDGQIRRPVLTMHGTGDLFVPIFLQQTLGRAVAAAGREDLLVQRVMRIPGHCGFSREEQIAAFDDLVNWVRNGAKPEGDSVFGDLRNAGLRFTRPLRPNDPGGLGIGPPAGSAAP